MVFQTSVRKELSNSFGATSIALSTIVVTMMLVRTLGQASRGNVNPSDVMLLMAYTVLGQLPVILGLSLLIAIVATLSRMYRDSEMVIWLVSGRGLMAFMTPLFRFAWPVLLIVAALSLFAWPWANLNIQYLRQQYENRGDVDRIAPGQFQESADGGRVFFIDKDSVENKNGNKIFIATTEEKIESITSAVGARVEKIENDRYILLENGKRQDINKITHETKLSEFLEYSAKIKTSTAQENQAASPKTLGTSDILRDRTPLNMAELFWRLGLLISAFNFIIIGLALSKVNPRTGRTGSLFLTLLSFIIYYNLLSLGQTWIISQIIDFSTLMIILHAGIFIASFLFLLKENYQFILSDLFSNKKL